MAAPPEPSAAHGCTPDPILTAYELARLPHTPITDDSLVSLPYKALDEEIVCPICLSVLEQTLTTKDCLHRFCSDCINTSLRFGKKECPTCRKACASRRSLRPDPAFDLIVQEAYPDRGVYEADQQDMLARLNKHHNQSALALSVEEGMRRQAETRSSRITKSSLQNTDKRAKRGETFEDTLCTPTILCPELEQATIHIQLDTSSPCPTGYMTKELKHRYVNVPGTATVGQLRQFVWLQYGLAAETKVLLDRLTENPELAKQVTLQCEKTDITDDTTKLAALLHDGADVRT